MFRFKRVVWFRKIDADDLVLVGKKAYDLNALYSSGFAVPPSFVVTAKAYTDFIKGFEGRLDYYLDKIDINDKQQLREIATKIQTLILSSDFPQMLEREILDAYESMNVDVGFSRQLRAFDFLKTGDKGVVAVRTSAVAKEPLAIKDREFISFMNIQGVVQLLRAIKACWASLFSTDNITHRVKNGYGHKDVYAAVVVQKMVKSEKSGILLTSNPNGNRNEAIIEICWGLGKTLPEVMPDSYTIDKKQNRILDESVHRQTWAYFGGVQGRIEKQDLPDKKLRSSKLDSAEMVKLGNIAKDVEDKYDEPYEIEFTFDKERMWIIGMKPMRGEKLKPAPVETEKISKEKADIDAEEETKEVDDIISNIFRAPPIKRPVKREETKILQPVVLNKPGTHPTIKVTQEVQEKEEAIEEETAKEIEPEQTIEEKEPFVEEKIIEEPEEQEEGTVPELEVYDVPEKKAEPERLSYEEQQKLIEEIKQKYAPSIVETEEEPEIEYEVAKEPELIMPNAAVVEKSKADIINKLKQIHAPMEETNRRPEETVEEKSEEMENIEEQDEMKEETEDVEESVTPDEEMMAETENEEPETEETEPQEESEEAEMGQEETTEETEDVEESVTPDEEMMAETEEEKTEFEVRMNLITERYIKTYPHMRGVFNEYKERVMKLYFELHH